MKKYDIFISYRRTAYETANLIATRLKAAGYSVFFDVETMRSGKFNEQLYDVIGQCKDFLLVLSPNALDRCKNKDDWVRLEACKAMECGKNIIPVMLNGFHWPEPMPNGMEELSNYQAIAANSVEYFDMAIKKLQEQYLHSKPKLPILRVLKAAAAGFAILVAVLLVLWGAFIIISKDTCQKYATLITQDAACVHVLAEANHDLAQRWEQFDRGLDLNREPRLSEMKEDMLSNINQAEKDIRRAWRTDSVPLSISPFQGFLLSLHGINSQELALSPQLATVCLHDFLDCLEQVRMAVKEPTAARRRYATALFQYSAYGHNAYYAAFLATLSPFPKSSQKSFDELSQHWIYFPIHYKTGEEESYYEKLINIENKRADDVLSRFSSYLEQLDAQLEDLENACDEQEKASGQLEEQAGQVLR